MIDVFDLVPEKQVSCLDKGFVRLIDSMPRLVEEGQTADHAIVQMARVSYASGTKTISEDRGLIRYLMRHAHTSPFEGVSFKFHMKMPMFAARQIIRHRTASVNEVSGRYSVMKDEFYFPEADDLREQSKTNKQGGGEAVSADVSGRFLQFLDEVCDSSYAEYERFLEAGVSREQARMVLPLNLYTEWYWKIDAHNLFHFLALRADPHTQAETRTFAEAMIKLITPIMPWSVEAWNDYHPMRGAMKLTRLEVDALRRFFAGDESLEISSDNKREIQEWRDKLSKIRG